MPELPGRPATEWWGVSLDAIADAIWDELRSDCTGAHYAAFPGERAEAREKLIAAFITLIDRHLYRATPYGAPWVDGEEDDE